MKINDIYKYLVVLMVFTLASCSKKLDTPVLPQTDFFGPKVTVYFTKASEDLGVILIPVTRKIEDGKSAYETAIAQLFLGPTYEEREKLKLHTEVPEGARLIKVDERGGEVKIDVSSQFMTGGGSETMQVRFRQLRETALNLAKGRPVFLYIDGTKVQMIGGEGLEVPQPLDSEDE